MSAVRHPYRLWSAFTNSLKGRGPIATPAVTIPAECGSIADNNDDLFLREHRNGNSHKGADNTEKPTAHVSSFRTSAFGRRLDRPTVMIGAVLDRHYRGLPFIPGRVGDRQEWQNDRQRRTDG